MLAPTLPGFIYDEVRKKYFRVTNGSSQAYHNSELQAKKRRLEHTKEPQKPKKGLTNTSKRALQYKLCPQTYQQRLLQLHLGTQSLSPASWARLRLKSLRLCLTLRCSNIRVWCGLSLGTEACLVVSQGRRLCLVKLDAIRALSSYKNGLGIASARLPLHFYYTSEQALTELFASNDPHLVVELVSSSGSYCTVTYKLGQENDFKYIYGFFKWEVSGPVDLSGSLISCLEKLSYEKKLLVLFLARSRAQIAVEGVTVLLQCPRKVYVLAYERGEFALKKEYVVGGKVSSFHHFSQPPKLKNGVLLYSSGNTLYVAIGNKSPVAITHNGPISNFFLLSSRFPGFRVLVVGLQKIAIHERLDVKVPPEEVNYLNENVRNQCSFLVEDNLVINRRNETLQISSLLSRESEIKELSGYSLSHGSLERFLEVGEGYLSVHSDYSTTTMSYYE